jgi:glycine cleavage system H lipoate-binding protein
MENPEIINDSPYDDGWIVTVNPEIGDYLSQLITPETYKKMLEKQEKSPFRVL